MAVAGLLLAERAGAAPVAPEQCAICGGAFGSTVYTVEDKVTGEKKQICHDCLVLPTACFICGLPVKTGYTELPDGRVICARDAKTAMLDEGQAVRTCRETRDNLDRLFSRFLSFPETNVTVSVIDRVHLQDLFKFAGRDYVCPNVWGYIEPRTNHNGLEHAISLLGGLPLAAFKATCAHEYTHAWLNENLSEHRKRSLSRDANEGFCELVSFLLMDSQNEEAQKEQILRNAYTRGQIHLFIAAERRYGFSDVVDWMKYGADDRLTSEDLGRIRRVEPARPSAGVAAAFPDYKFAPASVPDVLMLKGISWSQDQPLALINEQTFAVNETGKLRLGNTNVTIRCLAIREDAVRIQIVGSEEERELRFKR